MGSVKIYPATSNNCPLEMRELVLLCLVSVGQANPAPQYSGATGDLSDGTLDTIKDIFGAGLGDGTDSYSGGAETGKLDDGTNGGIGAVVQIVKNEDFFDTTNNNQYIDILSK